MTFLILTLEYQLPLFIQLLPRHSIEAQRTEILTDLELKVGDENRSTTA